MTDQPSPEREALERMESRVDEACLVPDAEFVRDIAALRALVERVGRPMLQCDTHGDWNPLHESGCPTCLRELRERVEKGVPCWTWLREDGLRVFDRAEPGMMCHAQRTLLLLPEETP